jgi:hypothetical protein
MTRRQKMFQGIILGFASILDGLCLLMSLGLIDSFLQMKWLNWHLNRIEKCSNPPVDLDQFPEYVWDKERGLHQKDRE